MVNTLGDNSAVTDGGSPASRSRRGCGWYLIPATVLVLVVGGGFIWRATRPVDTTPPKAVLEKVEPNKPLFDKNERQVNFVLRDDQGGIPTFFIFDGADQKVTALAINTLRGTPGERGVEIRFEAIRFRRDESDPDRLWVRGRDRQRITGEDADFAEPVGTR